jgi:predicted phosphoribosyltransferase
MLLLDRSEIGRELAGRLAAWNWRQPVVMAIPPGGVLIGLAIAQRLNAPLDVVSALEVLLPGPRGTRLGAVAPGVFIPAPESSQVDPGYLARLREADTGRQLADEKAYRGRQPPIELGGRDVIVVDDGWATPLMIHAAIESVARRGPAGITFASAECLVEAQQRIGRRATIVSLQVPRACRDLLLMDQRLCQMTQPEAARLIASTRGATAAQAGPWMDSIPGKSADRQASNVAAVHSESHS